MKNTNNSSDLPQLFNSINWEGENSLSYRLKQLIFETIQAVVGDKLDAKFADVKIEHPKMENYGDYSTNIALIMGKKAGMKAIEMAEKIANGLNKYIKEYQSTSATSDSFVHQDDQKIQAITKIEPKAFGGLLESVVVAGPGFVNLTIRRDYLGTLMERVLRSGNSSVTTSLQPINKQHTWIETGLPLQSKKIMVEFAHPNIHKEFHIGHLRNISIGESIIRTLESTGGKLFRANYEGDVGLHVAKAIWGVSEKIQKSNLKIAALRELNPANKAKFLGEGYALGSKAYEESEVVKKEIIELNKAIYKDPKKVELWEETRRWSLEYFETVYKRLGSHFDRYFFESEVESRGKQMVIDGVEKGIFIKDKDGSIYFPGEKYGLNNCVFVTRESYATYEGKDIAVESLEFEEFPFDVDIHVVAHEQRNFFQIAFKALEMINSTQIGRQFHLAYGMVNLKGAKLSSRTGKIITANWLIDQAKEKIKKIMKQTSRKDTSDGVRMHSSEVEETEKVAEKVAVAAVKYSMQKVNPKMDIAFDLEESVTFEGDSGPYLLYTYARCRSVLRKGGEDKVVSQLLKSPKSLRSLKEINTEELSLLRTLYRFPEIVVEAARNLSPNLICSFLFDLSQKYNLFYNKHSILQPTTHNPQPTTQFRLALTEATSIILARGLYLLGIETVEKM